ncbi:MAG: NADH-quinone oxidoreductase subunit H [Anaerolineales bacterium]|nr:NADH-quinone oxidoreductase subunit H [Anaerolineales bacterium]
MSMEIEILLKMLVFPGGLTLIALGLLYEYIDRKLMARFQNRIGPRFLQPLADAVKLLAKEEVVPQGVIPIFFVSLPILALAGALTAGLYVPMAGFAPAFSLPGDLIIVIFLLGLLTLSIGLAGANTADRFSILGATRTLTQLFSYEAPFLLALLCPAILADTWQIDMVHQSVLGRVWLALPLFIGFFVAVIGLMGKLELAPFDAPEAESEIVAGALTEYSGRGLALFRLGKNVELVVGLTLIAAFYLGGLANPLEFLLKTLGLLVVVAALQALFARLRIDQTVGMWWRIGALLALAQLLIVVILKGVIL